MKTIISKIAALSIILTALTGLFSCEKIDTNSSPNAYTRVLDVSAVGVSSIIEDNLKTVFLDEPIIQGDDEALLLHMLDEEKLARDVYNALYEKWNVSIFSNIAAAEQNHLNAILLLINSYTNLEVEVGEAGVYSKDEFALLYTQLVAQGSESLEAAYSVGALIEELDINDLLIYLDQTSNENVIIVFENLLRGSKNHLRAFNKNLVALGVEYTTQYLDAIIFEEIINAPMEQGKNYAKRNDNGKEGKSGKKGKGSNGQGKNGGNANGDCAL